MQFVNTFAPIIIFVLSTFAYRTTKVYMFQDVYGWPKESDKYASMCANMANGVGSLPLTLFQLLNVYDRVLESEYVDNPEEPGLISIVYHAHSNGKYGKEGRPWICQF